MKQLYPILLSALMLTACSESGGDSTLDTDGQNSNGSNNAPIGQDAELSVEEDNSISIPINGSDADGDDISVIIVNGPNYGELSQTDNTASYTPNLNYNGTDSFSYKLNDGELDSDIYEVTITVTPVNDAPVIEVDSTLPLLANLTNSVTYTVSDVDGDELVVEVSSVEDTLVSYTAAGGEAELSIGSVDKSSLLIATFTVSDGTTSTTSIETFDVNPTMVLQENVNAPWGSIEGEFVVAPSNNEHVYFVPNDLITNSLYVSKDSGSTWTSTSAELTNLSISPFSSSRLIGLASGVMKLSTNSGATWTTINSSNIEGTIKNVFFSKSEPSTLFAISESTVVDNIGGFVFSETPSVESYISTNSGKSWKHIATANTGSNDFFFSAADSIECSQTCFYLAVKEVDSLSSHYQHNVYHYSQTGDDWDVTEMTSELPNLLDSSLMSGIKLTDIQVDALSPTLVIADFENNEEGVTYLLTTSDPMISVKQRMGLYSAGFGYAYALPASTTSETTVDYFTDSNTGFTNTAYVIDGESNIVNLEPKSLAILKEQALIYSDNEILITTLPASNVTDIDISDYATAPVINDETFTVDLSETFEGQLAISDDDSDTFTISLETAPAFGQVELFDDGRFTYTAPGATGIDSFSVSANDGFLDSNVATITINVEDIEYSPVADNADFTVTEGSSLTGTLTGSDEDGDPLTFTLSTSASNGVAVVNENGSITYSPNDGFVGEDSFTYIVNDGKTDSAEGTVNIEVVTIGSQISTSTSGSVTSINGVIQNGSIVSFGITNNSLLELDLVRFELFDGDNVLYQSTTDTSLLSDGTLDPEENVGIQITVGAAGIKGPLKGVYTFTLPDSSEEKSKEITFSTSI